MTEVIVEQPQLYRAITENPLPVDWRLQVKEHIAKIGIPLDVYVFLLF